MREKEKKALGIDFDDVLMDFATAFTSYHNDMHGTDMSRDSLFTADVESTYGVPFPIFHERVHYFYKSEYHHEAPLIPGAKEALENLSHRYNIFIITARPDSVDQHTHSWIDKHFPDLFHDVFFTSLFHLDPKVGKPKVDICAEIGADILIDDSYPHLRAMVDKGGQGLLFDAPWNQDVEITPGIVRVKSWDDALKELS